MSLTTAVNQRLAEREQAAGQERLHAAKHALAHQLQASSLPGGVANGDPLQIFRRHDKEGKQGLSLEQFSAAIRRDGKLGRSKMTEKEVSMLFASLDTEKAGVVRIEKLSSLADGTGTAQRQPLGAVAGNGTPTPRDRHRRGKPAGSKTARSSGRAKLSKPLAAKAKQQAATIEVMQDPPGDVDAMAMLAAAEATVIAREQSSPRFSGVSTRSDESAPMISLLPSRRSISCIPRKPRPLGAVFTDAPSRTEPDAALPPVEHEADEDDTPPVSPVDESPCKDAPEPAHSPAGSEPTSASKEWSQAEHSRFEQALEVQGRNNSPPAEAWAAISAQMGNERTVAEVKAYGMRYFEQLSQEQQQEQEQEQEQEQPSAADAPKLHTNARQEDDLDGPRAQGKEQTPDAVDDAGGSGSSDWSQEERGRLAAALDILGPALLSPESLQAGQASQVWDSLASAVGGGRTAWETRCA